MRRFRDIVNFRLWPLHVARSEDRVNLRLRTIYTAISRRKDGRSRSSLPGRATGTLADHGSSITISTAASPKRAIFLLEWIICKRKTHRKLSDPVKRRISWIYLGLFKKMALGFGRGKRCCLGPKGESYARLGARVFRFRAGKTSLHGK